MSQELSKSINGFTLWATAVGMLIGPWIMYTKWFWELTGPSIVIVFSLSALIIIPIAFVFAELCTMLPASGGSYLYASVAFGPNIGFYAAWLSALSYNGLLAGNSKMAISLLQIAGIVPDSVILRNVVALLLIAFYFILNKLKVDIATKVSTIITVGLIFCGIAINGGMLGMSGEWTLENFKPFLTNGFPGLFTAVGIIVTMYFGFEAIPQFVEEAKLPVKKTASIILISIATAWFVYTVAMLSIAGVTPVKKMLTEKIASATIILDLWHGSILGAFGFLITIGMTALGTFAAGNGFWLALTRLYFSLGRSRALPEAFGRVNKNKVPHNANRLVLIIVTSIAISSGSNWLELLFLLMTLSITIVFLMGSLAFIKLRIKYPNRYRPLKLPGGISIGIISSLSSIYCIYCAAITIPIRGWLVFGVYCILGTIFVLYNNYMLRKKGLKPIVYEPAEPLNATSKLA